MSKTTREWYFYIDDMIRFSENVIVYSEGFTQINFINSGLNYDATLRNLELIGEAETHIPDVIKQAYSIIPWRQIVATRNQLIHGYLGIDNDVLWNIIQSDIPALLVKLELLKSDCENY